MAMLAPFITLYFLVLPAVGALVAVVLILAGPRPITAARVYETLIGQYLLWVVGLAYLVNFLLLIFTGPAQFGVAVASLGICIVGLYAVRRGGQARFAALLANSVFLWGAAAVYGFEIATSVQELTAGSAVVLLVAVALPLVGLDLLRRSERHPLPPVPASSANLDSSAASA